MAWPWGLRARLSLFTGEGQYGKVYTCINVDTGELMAMKEVGARPCGLCAGQSERGLCSRAGGLPECSQGTVSDVSNADVSHSLGICTFGAVGHLVGGFGGRL